MSKELQPRRESRSTDDFSETGSPDRWRERGGPATCAWWDVPPRPCAHCAIHEAGKNARCGGIRSSPLPLFIIEMAIAATRDQSVSSDTPTTEVAVAGVDQSTDSAARESVTPPILAASSYVVSANLLRQVVAVLEAGEGMLFDSPDVTPRSRFARLLTPSERFGARPEPSSSLCACAGRLRGSATDGRMKSDGTSVLCAWGVHRPARHALY